ncbi:hypothetical protein C8035_v006782 [Colletotrichum spinosum]|uniref:Protein kinase domain-containing protein n=1 Tax=Colletotrichum spinosum TaxID=1347390 RepID=A0A4R8QJK4_9PEZI|nr:hypothetical protein C8035_v006782 [Colletotrichum spinosum]
MDARVEDTKDYFSNLMTAGELQQLMPLGRDNAFEVVKLDHLETVACLPGKTGANIVRVRRRPSALVHDSHYVFKGMPLAAYLKEPKDFKEHYETTLIHEIITLCDMVPHPNIMPPPKMLVVFTLDGKNKICGFLQPAMKNDSVDAQVIRANKKQKRLSLSLKAKWCYQMALAIRHTHRVAKTYHMDFKPGNMLVDDNENIRLIDWEQSGVSMFTHAPEVVKDQSAKESNTFKNGKRRIIYTPNQQGPRKDLKWGFPDWNVYPDWKTVCPRAAELSEVFSLGRTMWMLLEQVAQNANQTEWTPASGDIPSEWKDMVMSCQKRDPNERPELDEVVKFWEEAWEMAKAEEIKAKAMATVKKTKDSKEINMTGDADGSKVA